MARHLKKHGGDVEKSLAAIPAGRSTRESLARIGDPDVGGTLAHLGSASTEHGDDADRTASYAVGTATSDGQRFRVLRPHARGGLGAVFVALDTELHREVALKQILDRHADDPTSRQRFLLEAEITGGLEHPGIVPVYGLGTYGDGRPYYAMRFIRGDSLKEAIEHFHADEALKHDPGRRSLELRKLLRRFLDVCNAIDYAHSRGVLHRDIKPGNIIVGKHGETLVVDWGLAKAIGQVRRRAPEERTLVPSSASGSAETLPGSALGTPAYMSPEQARGDLERLGPRSRRLQPGRDALLPADRPAAVRGRRRRRGAAGRAAGRVPAAPAARPDDRPGAGGGLPQGDGPAAGGPLRHAAGAGRGRRALDGRRAGLGLARAGWRRAGAVGAAAPAGGRRCGGAPGRGGRRPLRRHRPDQPRAGQGRGELPPGPRRGGRVLHHRQREQAARRARPPAPPQGTARLGPEILPGLPSASAPATPRSGPRRRRHRIGWPSSPTRSGRRRTRWSPSGEPWPSTRSWSMPTRRSRSISATLPSPTSTWPTCRATEAGSTRRWTPTGRPSPSVRRWPATIRPAHGTRTSCPRAAATSATCSAAWAGRPRRLPFTRKAVEINDRLVREDPAVIEFPTDIGRRYNTVKTFRMDLALDLNQFGLVCNALGQTAQAVEAGRRACAVMEALARDFPADIEIQSRLAGVYNDSAALMDNSGHQDEALRSLRRACEIREQLVASNPTVTGFSADLALSEANLGSVLYTQGHAEEGLRSALKGRAHWEELVAGHPDVSRYRNELARTCSTIGQIYYETDRPAEATPFVHRARDLLERLVADHPENAEYRSLLGRSYYNVGWLERKAGKPHEALRQFRRAREIEEKQAESSGEHYYMLACLWALCIPPGSDGPGARDAAEGRRCAEAAMDALRRALAVGFGDIAWLRRDPDLDVLRSREDFRALLDQLTKAKTPPAVPRVDNAEGAESRRIV